jgi:hypothetical protein
MRTGVPWEAAVEEDGKEFRDKEDEIFEKRENTRKLKLPRDRTDLGERSWCQTDKVGQNTLLTHRPTNPLSHFTGIKHV